jgi:hypothetical protein
VISLGTREKNLEEERKKIRKTNHLRGQPTRNPSEKSKKEQMEEIRGQKC